MNSLLPEVVRDEIVGRSLYSASESYGLVALVLLVALLLELEALRVLRTAPARATIVSALAIPLLLAVMLTIILRVTALMD